MKKLLLPLFLLGTVVMMLLMADSGKLLKTPAAPLGIINLELANTAAKTQAIINSWLPAAGSNRIDAAKFNTYSDFLFLFFYAGFLFLTCKKIAAHIKGPLSKAGNIIATAALIAGFADVMENTGLLFSLNNIISQTVSFSTAFFSAIKWTLVVIAVIYILAGLPALVFQKLKK